MQVANLEKASMHHAYLINAEQTQLDNLLDSIESVLDIKLQGNPDALVLSDSVLTVDMARSAVSRAGSSSIIPGSLKVIILAFTQATVEAQNALLKSLEEPAKDTHIFILTSNTDVLLPTVLSRCMKVELGCDSAEAGSISDSTKEFIKSSVPERLKTIEKLAKKKDRPAMLELLSGVEMHLSNHKPKSTSDESWLAWRGQVRAVLQAQEYIRDKGAMSKMLMESMALVV